MMVRVNPEVSYGRRTISWWSLRAFATRSFTHREVTRIVSSALSSGRPASSSTHRPVRVFARTRGSGGSPAGWLADDDADGAASTAVAAPAVLGAVAAATVADVSGAGGD